MSHLNNALKRYARGEFRYEFIARSNRRSGSLEARRRHYQHNSNILAVVLVTRILYELTKYKRKSGEKQKLKRAINTPFLVLAEIF